MTNAKHGLEPRYLCEPPTTDSPERDNHLRSAHGELHQELGLMLAGVTAPTLGHIEAGDIYPAIMVQRHDELAAEIQRRGGTHTPGHKGEYDTFADAVAEARERHPALFEPIPSDGRLAELRKRHLGDCPACAARYDRRSGSQAEVPA